jgi:hypothetical protein
VIVVKTYLALKGGGDIKDAPVALL